MKLEDIPDNAELRQRTPWECFKLIPSQTRRLHAGNKFGWWSSFHLAFAAFRLGLPFAIVLPSTECHMGVIVDEPPKPITASSFNGRTLDSLSKNAGSTPVDATKFQSDTPIWCETFPLRKS